jgi:hypothetical protein
MTSEPVGTYGDASFAPETAADRLRRTGFRSCHELAGDELWARYLPGEPPEAARPMRIGVAIV